MTKISDIHESDMGKHKHPKQLEKLMAYVLGRQPDEFGLVLDERGFVRLKDLLKAISEEPGWGHVRRSHIQEVLVASGSASFVLEGEKIKAVSRDEAPDCRETSVLPKVLYHCVRRKAYSVICKQGITPLGQPAVFLAVNEELARRMGRRRDPSPVLLAVHAKRAGEAGVKFSKYGRFLYIADHVPVSYFTGPPPPQDKGRERSKPKVEAVSGLGDLPGSFILSMERSEALQRQRLKRKGLKKEIAWKKDVRRLKRKSRS
jgi:putative RNA 2'-phosphotransferase